MPRAPVKPQDRQRIGRACDSCKVSKKRCNGHQPCVTCEKKGHHNVCHYTVDRRHNPRPRHNSAVSRQHSCSMSHSNMTGDADDPTSSNLLLDITDGTIVSPRSMGSNYMDALDRHGSESAINDTTRDSSSEPLCQPPVMLASVSGDKGKRALI